MAEVNQEQVDARFKQFISQVKSNLAEGGILVSGQVTQKNKWPAKEGKDASLNVRLSYFGASYTVSVSQKLYDSVGVGTFQVFVVAQRASGNAIYNTAIE